MCSEKKSQSWMNWKLSNFEKGAFSESFWAFVRRSSKAFEFWAFLGVTIFLSSQSFFLSQVFLYLPTSDLLWFSRHWWRLWMSFRKACREFQAKPAMREKLAMYHSKSRNVFYLWSIEVWRVVCCCSNGWFRWRNSVYRSSWCRANAMCRRWRCLKMTKTNDSE